MRNQRFSFEISTPIESAKELLEVARKNNIRLLIGHHRRFNRYVIKAKAYSRVGLAWANHCCKWPMDDTQATRIFHA